MNNNNNNWTSWALTGGAAGAAGLYYTKKQFGSLTNAFEHAFSPTEIIQTSNRNVVKETIRDVVSRQIDVSKINEIQASLMKNRFDRLTDKLSKYQTLPSFGEVISREWEQAKNSTLPTGLEVNYSISKSNALEDLGKVLQQRPSIYTSDLLNRFISNVETVTSTGEFSGMSKLQFPSLGAIRMNQPIPDEIQGLARSLRGVMHESLDITNNNGEYNFNLPGNKKPLFSIEEAFGPEGMQKGMIRTGGHNIYAPGLFSEMSSTGNLSSPMNWTQFKSKEILKAAEEAKSKGISIEQAIRERDKSLGKLLDYSEPSLTGDDLSLQSISKSQRLTVLDELGNPVTGMKAQNLLIDQAGKLFPTSKAGTFSTMDQKEIFGHFSNDIEYSRKPGQWIKEFRPSEAAQAAISQGEFGGQEFNFVDSPLAIKQFNGPSGPRLKTLYLDDDQIEMLRKFGHSIGDGELLVNSRFKRQAEVTRRRRVTLSEISDDFNSKYMYTRSQGGLPDIDNMLLGRDTTGSLVKGSGLERVVQANPITLKSGQHGLDLVIEETIEMGRFEKRFGGLKGMGRAVHFRDIAKKKALRKALGLSGEEIKSFGAIGRLSDIEKNPALKRMQEFSGLVLEGKLNKVSDPNQLANIFSSSSNPRAAMEDFAKGIGITPETDAYKRIFGKNVIGISRLHFGGTKEFTGAGKMGTLEPRILTLLEGRQDEFGTSLGADLVSRVIKDNPEKLGFHSELRKTLASFSESNRQAGVDISNLNYSDMERLRKEGGYIKTGIETVPSIYLPSTDRATSLRPSMIDGRLVNTSETSKTLAEMENYIKSRGVTKLDSEAEVLNKLTGEGGFLSRLYQEYAPAGKGEGSLAKGKLVGSRFLTAVSEDSPFLQQVNKLGLNKSQVVGAPLDYGKQMIQELIDRGEDMGDTMERFMSGQPVEAAIARHPFIGPYSVQPVQMLRIDEPSPVIFMPERNVKLPLTGIGEETILKGVNIGMAADKDADIIMLTALNKDMQRKAGLALQDATQQSLYAHHVARMQLAKAKVFTDIGEAGLTRGQQVAAAATKLGITDEYVGRVSAQLSQARSAVNSSNMDRATKLKSLGLLEWLEQQPISGKHLSSKKVLQGAFQKQMEAIISGATGDSNLMRNTVEEMLKIDLEGITDPDKLSKAMKKQKVIQGILGTGLDLDSPVNIAGTSINRIEGFDIENTLPKIAEAIKEHSSIKPGGMAPSQVDKFMKPGRFMNLRGNQIDDALAATDVLSKVDTGGWRALQTNLLTDINKAYSQVATRIKPFTKPAMAALAVAGAVSLLTSGPPQTMQEPSLSGDRFGEMMEVSSQMTNKSRDEVNIEDHSQILGQPIDPAVMQPKAVQLGQGFQSARDIRMEITANNISRGQREELVNRINSRYPGRINVNVNDNRKKLNQWSLSDMMD